MKKRMIGPVPRAGKGSGGQVVEQGQVQVMHIGKGGEGVGRALYLLPGAQVDDGAQPGVVQVGDLVLRQAVQAVGAQKLPPRGALPVLRGKAAKVADVMGPLQGQMAAGRAHRNALTRSPSTTAISF